MFNVNDSVLEEKWREREKERGISMNMTSEAHDFRRRNNSNKKKSQYN